MQQPIIAPYSQVKASLAIAKASLKALLRSPSTVLFSLGFPLVFILVFGFLGGGQSAAPKIAFSAAVDTNNVLYAFLKNSSDLQMVNGTPEYLNDELSKGRLLAVLSLTNSPSGVYEIKMLSSEAVDPSSLKFLETVLQGKISQLNRVLHPSQETIATISPQIQWLEGRRYRAIDFILPGQLGFSLMSAAVFGVAFLFIGLRQTLVLKRYFATPISKTSILVGEGISRVLFQISTAVIILGVGHIFFQFTLVNGWLTFLELLVLCLLGLFVFMGFGFLVSGLAKNEAAVPPIANIITLPQFLLSGTFFSIQEFPSWLQPICKALPLTHLNNAMRNIAFEGAHLQDCWVELLVLVLWMIIGYAGAVKLFRWE